MNTAKPDSHGDYLTSVWYFFVSDRWIALLLALLAATLALSMLLSGISSLPQPSPATRIVSDRGVAWLQSGPFSPRVANFGGYDELWLRLLFGLGAFTLMLRTAERSVLVLHLRNELARARGLYLEGEAVHESVLHTGVTLEGVRERLGKRGGAWAYRVWEGLEETRPVVYAERLRFAVWGDLLLHASCLVVLVGVFVTTHWGWQEERIALARGEKYSVAHAPGYVLALEGLVTHGSGGRDDAETRVSRVAVYRPAGTVQESVVGVAAPCFAGPFGVFPLSTGPALRLSVREDSGEPLYLQSLVQGLKPDTELVLKFLETQDENSLSIPSLGITLRVDRYPSLPEQGYGGPVYLLRAYRGNRSVPLFSRYIWRDDVFEWQGLEYDVRLDEYVVFNIAADVGWWLVMSGFAGLVVGGMLRLWPTPVLARFRFPQNDGADLASGEVSVWCGGNGVPGDRSGVAEDLLRRVRRGEE